MGGSHNNGAGSKAYKNGRSVWIDSDMFTSEPFQSLSKSAMITLMRFLQKRTWEGKGKKRRYIPNEEFIFPYTEAASFGIGTTQHWKNINTLIELGFIDLVHQGGSYQGPQEKDYSRYRLSDRWKRYGKVDFRHVEKEKSLRPDCYIQRNIEKKSRTTSQKRSCHLHKSEVERAGKAKGRLHESEVDDRVSRDAKGATNAT